MTQTNGSLSGLRFTLVGPGRVGASLASWLRASGATCLEVIGRPGSPRAAELAGRLGAREGLLDRLAPDDLDLLLLAAPDESLVAIARRLAGHCPARIALHTAGSLGASVLAALRPRTAVGSFHPLLAFPHALEDPSQAAGIFFALDGDRAAIELGMSLAGSWGGVAAEIGEAERPLYHLGARLAAGGVITLLAVADEIARRTSLPREVVGGYLRLARGALERASQVARPGEAITGPVPRDDGETLAEQAHQIALYLPELAALVETLDDATRRQCRLAEEVVEDRDTLPRRDRA